MGGRLAKPTNLTARWRPETEPPVHALSSPDSKQPAAASRPTLQACTHFTNANTTPPNPPTRWQRRLGGSLAEECGLPRRRQHRPQLAVEISQQVGGGGQHGVAGLPLRDAQRAQRGQQQAAELVAVQGEPGRGVGAGGEAVSDKPHEGEVGKEGCSLAGGVSQ